MPNHPDRNPLGAFPSAEAVKALRVANGLTQSQAGALVYCQDRMWRLYESGERRMPPAAWELFNIKLKALKNEI